MLFSYSARSTVERFDQKNMKADVSFCPEHENRGQDSQLGKNKKSRCLLIPMCGVGSSAFLLWIRPHTGEK